MKGKNNLVDLDRATSNLGPDDLVRAVQHCATTPPRHPARDSGGDASLTNCPSSVARLSRCYARGAVTPASSPSTCQRRRVMMRALPELSHPRGVASARSAQKKRSAVRRSLCAAPAPCSTLGAMACRRRVRDGVLQHAASLSLSAPTCAEFPCTRCSPQSDGRHPRPARHGRLRRASDRRLRRRGPQV